jgi:hypothetical protein
MEGVRRMANSVRALVLVLIIFAAALIGITIGLLSWIGGLDIPKSILSGAASMGTAIVVFLTAVNFLFPGNREKP